jgi:phenylpropionate dioxygenase-like ring-hydroxylating dioxygenase large terminal subunit
VKLDKQKWIKEVRRIEAEIKGLKKAMHEPHYQATFSFQKLFQLKAEATRLYVLRRVMKKKDIKLKSFWYLVESQDKRYVWTYWKKAIPCTCSNDEVLCELLIDLILNKVPSWKATLMEDEILETPSFL